MPKWWGKDDAEETEAAAKAAKEAEVKPPKEITDRLDKIDGLETSINEVKTKFSVLDDMKTYLDEQKQAKEVARRKEAEERARKATEESADTWLTDPAAAAKEMLQPLVIDQINTKSRLLRREMFEDGTQYEFYQGAFKDKVDAYIDKLPVAARTDADSIKNCYFLVLGQNQNEIKEGKLKSRFAATSTSSAKDGKGGSEGEKTITLTDEQKRAADKLGVKHEAYAKNLGEMSYV